MIADLPSDWLTAESVVTLTGASAAVVAVSNTTWKLFRWKPLIVGIVASVLLVAYGTYVAGTYASVGGILIALVNACVLFSLAFGIDETLNALAKGAGAGAGAAVATDASTARGRPWLRSWID